MCIAEGSGRSSHKFKFNDLASSIFWLLYYYCITIMGEFCESAVKSVAQNIEFSRAILSSRQTHGKARLCLIHPCFLLPFPLSFLSSFLLALPPSLLAYLSDLPLSSLPFSRLPFLPFFYLPFWAS